mgnify:CR=1 FL=1
MNKNYEKLQEYIEKSIAMSSALAIFEWDNETLAPEKAIENTSKVMGILAKENHKALINDEVKDLLDTLDKEKDLTLTEKKTVEKLKKEYEQLNAVTAEEYQAYNELTARSSNAWAKAKEQNDFSIFAPFLEKIIAFNKKMAANRSKDEGSIYNVLLDDFEEGFTTDVLDKFFSELKEGILPLANKIKEKEDKIVNAVVNDKVPKDVSLTSDLTLEELEANYLKQYEYHFQ